MGKTTQFEAKKLVIGIITVPDIEAGDIVKVLVDRFGRVDYRSRTIPFDFTDYYRGEMGGDLLRYFLSFAEHVDPAELPEIKLATNEIEEHLSVSGNRRVNLDPGLLDLSRLILATTKDNAHRIPLRDGMYGEITLMYRKKDFMSLDWTYPDYRSEEYREILREIREIYREDLKRE
ncbi:MAG: DUF4416 family protein [Spirochaetota bacterium]